MAQPHGEELQAILERQAELRDRYLLPAGERPAPTTLGVHHAAFIARDVEETILFYRDVLGLPLVDLIENRDYRGSTHFFFDMGGENMLAFFDFPGHPHPDYAETVGGGHHVALSVTPEVFATVKARLDEQGIAYAVFPTEVADSMFLADPNGLRIELITEPKGYALGEYIL
ncbi:VOC family protein [Actinacidiphila glaucinigra]|uniref:Glyoxylase I family protein n=1 Tax=Actinacidiphila glaucinigra TaxID=235986 RepID=A0A238ZFJ5_9ACTN|nr:VOC family protein [Actinacidiphila glaucinigra]SNR81454.1 glyoxylase I family protein [Actinacidiphila glaucinigra]